MKRRLGKAFKIAGGARLVIGGYHLSTESGKTRHR